MDEPEKIKGRAIPKLLNELLHYKTLLKLTLVDADYEQLTLITALVERNNAPHFSIDKPAGFQRATAAADQRQLYFEFTGKDHIRYTFSTAGAEIDRRQIYIPYPRKIERWQRRELFRIKAPAGTRLCLKEHAAPQQFDVINISLGGMLAALVQTRTGHLDKAPFTDQQFLSNIELVFPPEIMPQPIRIKTVQVKRQKKTSKKTEFEVGLEFCEISAGEKKRLTDLFYKLQRQQLRNRLPQKI